MNHDTQPYPRCKAHGEPAPMSVRMHGAEEPVCILCVEHNHDAIAACVQAERASDAERRPALWAMWGRP